MSRSAEFHVQSKGRAADRKEQRERTTQQDKQHSSRKMFTAHMNPPLPLRVANVLPGGHGYNGRLGHH